MALLFVRVNQQTLFIIIQPFLELVSLIVMFAREILRLVHCPIFCGVTCDHQGHVRGALFVALVGVHLEFRGSI